MKKVILKKEIIIPVGTEFACIDGLTKKMVDGNYESLGMLWGKDTIVSIVIDEDALGEYPERFSVKEDQDAV